VDQNFTDTTGPDELNMALASQLRLCLVALEIKQSDSAICKYRDTYRLSPYLRSPCTAQGGGHEIWEAILEMVKSVSEVLLSSLPNFWKIAKSFLEGKFKKVRLYPNLLLPCFNLKNSLQALDGVHSSADKWHWTL